METKCYITLKHFFSFGGMKKYLKHFPFITAIILFLIGISDIDDKTNFLDPFNEPSQYFFTATFLIMFFLWKNNYFTKNK